ncbi:MAG: Rsd/AlgQ family anti-sigma factor [Cycloclasticus sp.]
MSSENVVQFKERDHTGALITELLQERKEVWTLYCTVSGIEEHPTNKSFEELIQAFCQLAVDYISLGHFGVYAKILDGSERRKSVVEAAARIYPAMSKATEAVLDFNDKYQKITPAKIVNELSGDLSILGEHLANRIELEDELLGEMLG